MIVLGYRDHTAIMQHTATMLPQARPRRRKPAACLGDIRCSDSFLLHSNTNDEAASVEDAAHGVGRAPPQLRQQSRMLNQREESDLFRVICDRDMEGVVAKQASAKYTPEATTWVKIKNRQYSQALGREDFFNRPKASPTT